ncbi:hypothetical protein JD844_021727 [Phrynosoma platyrhinos]|uniref:Ovochymase 2 n=1 Tax=Phrynosoma platyrhinos TaxID=52577 RepID=A0ABQ7SUD0_PHRPL|nr:hypothetical protein JD844_021727 [Phrynosoma platyrhinos]
MPVATGCLLLLVLGTTYFQEGRSTPGSVQGSKCGQKNYATDPWSFYGYLSRIVGGTQVRQGSHPWQCASDLGNMHVNVKVCQMLDMSFENIDPALYLLSSLSVTAGEHDLSLRDVEEQTLQVKQIIKHPKFTRKKPMDYDIALLKMNGHFKYGSTVWPVCLPDPNEKFDPGFICVTCGWGRLRENGMLPEVLHEVELPILDQNECSRVLSTLKKPIQGDTIMCAGFPDGGKDACQGDSGGSLVCRRDHGSWTLIGVTSWGIGCARSWMHNLKKKYERRGTPGIFTDLTKVLPWIQQHMDADVKMKSPTEGMHILLNFSHFDVEPDPFCDYDSLSVISMDDRLVDSGCGSLAILFQEGTVQSMHYPEPYSNLADCQWIIHAPENHVIKLTYEHFELEKNEDCTYDSVTVYENVVKENEIARSCGFAVPAPVLSSSSTMLIRFHSDETETFGGFKAKFLFISVTDDICGVALNQPRFLFSRIVGGEEAVPYSWPWQASIQILGENLCGGTVLTSTWVITAAHCLKEREKYKDLWRVVAGAHDIGDQEQNSQKRSVKQYLLHPDFNATTTDSDIALVQLMEPFEFNHYVRPVCLPKRDEKIEPSRLCVITGWGIQYEDGEKSRKLHQLEVPILMSEECQKYYMNHSGGLNKRMFCAGFPAEGEKDACTGDSGGPLVCPSEDSSYYTLNGIISWGLGCGRKGYPGVYTNVASFTDWIGQHIFGNSRHPCFFQQLQLIWT